MIFSSSDPPSSSMIPLNWTSFYIGISMMTWSLINSLLNVIYIDLLNKALMMLRSEFKMLLGANTEGMMLMFIVLFLFILHNNFLGLFPYLSTSTSHLAFTLAMALPMWISFMLFGWINNAMHMLALLVPQDTPGALMPFMIMIETVKNIIHPVRLTANMIAGHLLMTLLGNMGPYLSLMMINLLLISQLLLIILESAVICCDLLLEFSWAVNGTEKAML